MIVYLAQPIDWADDTDYGQQVVAQLAVFGRANIPVMVFRPDRAFDMIAYPGTFTRLAGHVKEVNDSVLRKADVMVIILPPGMPFSWGVPQEVQTFKDNNPHNPIFIWDVGGKLKGKGASVNLLARALGDMGQTSMSDDLKGMLRPSNLTGRKYNAEAYLMGYDEEERLSDG